jgi:hypothetical protein
MPQSNNLCQQKFDLAVTLEFIPVKVDGILEWFNSNLFQKPCFLPSKTGTMPRMQVRSYAHGPFFYLHPNSIVFPEAPVSLSRPDSRGMALNRRSAFPSSTDMQSIQSVAQPVSSSPTAEELDDWFWGETVAAKVLFVLKDTCLKRDNKMMQLLGKILLIPMSHSDA